jgi:outer membrane protein assembly factor BamB
VVSGGAVYVPLLVRVFDPFVNGFVDKGFIYALDAASGTDIWNYTYAPDTLGIKPEFALTVDNGLIFTTDASFLTIQAVRTTDGTTAWSRHFQGGTSPIHGTAGGDGRLFLPHIHGLMALDQATGTTVWDRSISLPRAGGIPLFAEGTVYVGSGEDSLPGAMFAFNAADGTIRWKVGGFDEIINSTPAYDGSSIYFSTSNHASEKEHGYVALDAATGEGLWFALVPARPESSLAYANGHLYGVAEDGVVRVLDAVTGALVEAHALDDLARSSHVALANGFVFVQDRAGTLYAFAGQEDPDADDDGDADAFDCAPLDPSRHHGAAERCNGIDDNCVGGADEGFPDTDFDGQADCIDPDDDNDLVPDELDCGPTNPSVYPGAPEVCDTFDNDCDGTVDEGFDADGDGYTSCVNDCNDSNPAVHPGATEQCNFIDDDCDGIVDEGFDADGDGWTTCEGDCRDDDPRINGLEVPEVNASCFDQVDNDCDGVVDCDCAIDVNPPERVQFGTIPTGGLGAMQACSAPDDVYYSVGEDSQKRLAAFYTLPLPPPTGGSGSVWWALRVEGYRTGNDALTFSWARRNVAGQCLESTPEVYATALTLNKTADDDRLQVFQIGPPAFDTISFCIRVMDAGGRDNTADTLFLDRMYLMPINLDSKATNELLTIEGTRVSGTYLNTQTVGDGQEVLREGPPTNRLNHIWIFDNVPVGFTHQLYFEATRPENSEKDNFQFSWAPPLPDGSPGTFTDIPGALVSNPTAPGAVTSGNFGTAGMVGRAFIRVRDTKPSGSLLDTVSIDYLAIRTTP